LEHHTSLIESLIGAVNTLSPEAAGWVTDVVGIEDV
jgi:hypothetical protein